MRALTQFRSFARRLARLAPPLERELHRFAIKSMNKFLVPALRTIGLAVLILRGDFSRAFFSVGEPAKYVRWCTIPSPLTLTLTLALTHPTDPTLCLIILIIPMAICHAQVYDCRVHASADESDSGAEVHAQAEVHPQRARLKDTHVLINTCWARRTMP